MSRRILQKNDDLCVKPLFFHRPSRTSTYDSAESIATPPLESDGMEWNLMEVSRLRSGRLSKQKKTTLSMQHGPLSARGELQSHPLAGKAQACGRPTQVDGPEGPMAPVVATG